MGFFKNLVSGITGSSAKKAANIAAAGRADAQAQFDNLISDFFRPQAEQSADARNQLAAFLGISGPEAQRSAFTNFQNDPGFQASLDAGLRAVDQSASAGGQLNSGGRQKALFRFGQQAQNQQFNQRLNRLAQFQPNATAQLAGVTGARNNQRIGVADAQAQGVIGASNAATGFVNQLAQLASNVAGKAVSGGFGG